MSSAFFEALALVRAVTISLQRRTQERPFELPCELAEALQKHTLLGPQGRVSLLLRRVHAGFSFHRGWPMSLPDTTAQEVRADSEASAGMVPARWSILGRPGSPGSDPLEAWWLSARSSASRALHAGHLNANGHCFFYGSEGALIQAPATARARADELVTRGAHQATIHELRGRSHHRTEDAAASFIAWWAPAEDAQPERLALQFHLDDWGMVTGVLLLERDGRAATEEDRSSPSPLFAACLAEAWFLCGSAIGDYTLLLDQQIGARLIKMIAEQTHPTPSAQGVTEGTGSILSRPIHVAARRLDPLVNAVAASVLATTARVIVADGPERLAVLSSVGTEVRNDRLCFSYRDGSRSITRYLAEVRAPITAGEQRAALGFADGQAIRRAYQILQPPGPVGTPDRPTPQDIGHKFFASEALLHPDLAPSRKNWGEDGGSAAASPKRPFGDALLGPWCYAAVKLDTTLFPSRRVTLNPRDSFAEAFKLDNTYTADSGRWGVLKVQGRVPCRPLDEEDRPPPFCRNERRWLHLLADMLGTVFQQTCRVELRTVTLGIARRVAELHRREGIGPALEQLRHALDAMGVVLVTRDYHGRGVWRSDVSEVLRTKILKRATHPRSDGPLYSALSGLPTEDRVQVEDGAPPIALFYPIPGDDFVLVIVGVANDFGDVDLDSHPSPTLPRMLFPVVESVCVVLSSIRPKELRAFLDPGPAPAPEDEDAPLQALGKVWKQLHRSRPPGARAWLCDFAATFPNADEEAAEILGVTGKTVRVHARAVLGLGKLDRVDWDALAVEGQRRPLQELVAQGERLLAKKEAAS